MSTCETCIHWTAGVLNPKIGSCGSPKFVYTDDKKTPVDGLGYWDFECYQAGFETGYKFGCIHYESK